MFALSRFERRNEMIDENRSMPPIREVSGRYRHRSRAERANVDDDDDGDDVEVDGEDGGEEEKEDAGELNERKLQKMEQAAAVAAAVVSTEMEKNVNNGIRCKNTFRIMTFARSLFVPLHFTECIGFAENN